MFSDRFFAATRYAADAQAGQLRKGTNVPYFSHLTGVTSIVIDAGGDEEEEAMAALLRDAAEGPVGRERLDDIRAKGGPLVDELARIVRGLEREVGY